MNAQLDPWLNIHSHMRTMMIEQIMALIGRASSDPKQYRRTLESFETATLQRTLRELHESTLIEIRTSFPAPELTAACEEPRRIQADNTSGSAQETLQSATTPQLSTPQPLNSDL